MKLLKIFGVKSLEQLREFLDSNSDLFKKALDLNEEKTLWQIKKYKEEVLSLQIKNKLALIHDLKLSPEIAVKISNGSLDLQKALSPNLGAEICDLCNHKHTTTEPRVCTAISCNCGMR